MQEVLVDWVANHWLELVSVGVAIGALLYARRAYHLSKEGAEAAKSSELINLRIKAKSGLIEVERSLQKLRSANRTVRLAWDHYERKHIPTLGSFNHRPEELTSNANVEHQGIAILQKVNKRFADIDTMKADQLEIGFRETRHAALRIESLIDHLEHPPHP